MIKFESIEVNSRKKLDRIINVMKRANRHCCYDKFYGIDATWYVLWYYTK